MMKSGIFAVAVLVAAAGATAAPPATNDDEAERAAAQAQTEQAAETQSEPQEEKKICRTERATGSLTRRTRVCLTAAQWREINDRTYRGVTEMQGNASGSQAIANNQGAGG